MLWWHLIFWVVEVVITAISYLSLITSFSLGSRIIVLLLEIYKKKIVPWPPETDNEVFFVGPLALSL